MSINSRILYLIAAVVVFLVLVSLRRRREAIRHAVRRVFFAEATYLLVVYSMVQAGRTTLEALLAGVLSGFVVNQMTPSRSRHIPAAIRRRKIAEYEVRSGKKFNPRKHELDHEVPFSRGGSHTEDNLVVTEKRRNRSLVNVNQALPDSQITIDPSATLASTTFDPVNKVWITTIPWDLDDNAFLTGVPWLIPSAGLPADVEPVTVCGTFASDVANIDIGWRWAAAAYSSFGSDNNVLGVKPMDTDHDNQALNHDRAGTPENYKQFVIPGARSKGAKNYTGSYSRSSIME